MSEKTLQAWIKHKKKKWNKIKTTGLPLVAMVYLFAVTAAPAPASVPPPVSGPASATLPFSRLATRPLAVTRPASFTWFTARSTTIPWTRSFSISVPSIYRSVASVSIPRSITWPTLLSSIPRSRPSSITGPRPVSLWAPVTRPWTPFAAISVILIPPAKIEEFYGII